MGKFGIAALYFFLIVCLGRPQSCTARHKAPLDIPESGQWLVEFNSHDIGLVRLMLTFQMTDTSFVAYTRKGADRALLGYWKSVLARMFTKDFKEGSLIRITDGKAKRQGDTLLLAGIFRSALGNYYFHGHMVGTTLQAKLSNRKQESKGQINGNKERALLPLSDYPAIVEKTLALAEEKLYDRKVAEGSDWKKFVRSIKRVSHKAQDDLELVFAFYYYSRKLPVSHFSLLRMPPKPDSGKAEQPLGRQAVLQELSPTTAYVKISSFGGTTAEMDSIFGKIRESQYQNLIVDLRDNSGGSVEAGMRFATHVADREFYGGVFLTRKWFDRNPAPPDVEQYPQLPHFTEANYNLIIDGIHNHEGLCLKVVPEEHPYRGRLFVLTNSKTASTCEPIVYGLKQYNRATIVGSKTAGAMLNGEFFLVADGFKVVVPTADYYTADGYRIDQKGVVPHIAVDPENALEYVLDNLL